MAFRDYGYRFDVFKKILIKKSLNEECVFPWKTYSSSSERISVASLNTLTFFNQIDSFGNNFDLEENFNRNVETYQIEKQCAETFMSEL